MAGWTQTANLKGPIGPAGAGLKARGPWTSGSTYAVNDLVTYNGSTWRAMSVHTATATGTTGAPATTGPTAAVWEQLAAGADQNKVFYGLTLDKTTALLTLTKVSSESGTVIDVNSYAAYFLAADGATLTWNPQRLANVVLTAAL